jgi:hypothetical protein
VEDNMSKNIIPPLKDRAHFRKIREVITEIAKYEKINIQEYDFLSIRAYETYGENLKGKNVSYNTDGNYSCWVLDNNYNFFEVPAKTNEKGSPYGEFLFFAHNIVHDYYQLGTMKVSLDKNKTIKTKFVTEKIHFKPCGKYIITFQGAINHINKVEYGHKFTPGVKSNEHNFAFDSYNSRKKNAYGKTNQNILESLGINGINPEKLISKDKVKVYNKKPGNKKQN